MDGLCNKPAKYNLEDFIKPYALEERIYRFRCVEAWSFVIPWVGIPLSEFIKRAEPQGKAQVRRVHDAARRRRASRCSGPTLLEWPYREGLRLDEANHPLSIMAVGLYGEVLPAQNGAPIRLMVPWKYGFKSIKSIVRMRFVEKQPLNTWQAMAPQRVRVLRQREPDRGSSALEPGAREAAAELHRQPPTEMFNGYADQVQSLYAGMDLRRNF